MDSLGGPQRPTKIINQAKKSEWYRNHRAAQLHREGDLHLIHLLHASLVTLI